MTSRTAVCQKTERTGGQKSKETQESMPHRTRFAQQNPPTPTPHPLPNFSTIKNNLHDTPVYDAASPYKVQLQKVEWFRRYRLDSK